MLGGEAELREQRVKQLDLRVAELGEALAQQQLLCQRIPQLEKSLSETQAAAETGTDLLNASEMECSRLRAHLEEASADLEDHRSRRADNVKVGGVNTSSCPAHYFWLVLRIFFCFVDAMCLSSWRKKCWL